MRKSIKNQKKDLIIFGVLLALILVSLGVNYKLFQNKGTVYCEISLDGKLVETVALTENRRFSIDEKPAVVFEVKDHTIAFVESDCPDKVCVHAGYLGHTGQSASCLPNKLTIRICSDHKEPDEPDVVAAFHVVSAADWSRYEE